MVADQHRFTLTGIASSPGIISGRAGRVDGEAS
jgi:hypothetical protein